ncbi:MAG: nucleoside hydrolase [Deltaproteobacteria bacterium]|nr:nucleoside hydrolase [Deltaproteobacteria bacterium]
MDSKPGAVTRQPNIWIDTDVALGAPAGDVDDGFALAFLFSLARRGRIRVLGISTVDGNTDASTAAGCARALVSLFELDVPVVSGPAAATRMAKLTSGSSILAIGPLTNVARAIREDPTLPIRTELRVVATVSRPLCAPHLVPFDLNVKRDRVAARACLGAEFRRLRVFPLDVVSRLRFGADVLDRLSSLGTPCAYVAGHARRWLARTPFMSMGRDAREGIGLWRSFLWRAFPVWDLVAAMEAADSLPNARFVGSVLESFDVDAATESFLDTLRLRAR